MKHLSPIPGTIESEAAFLKDPSMSHVQYSLSNIITIIE